MNERTKDEDAPIRPALTERLVVVGLGLIGGSVARGLRRASPNTSIVGVDRQVILEVALEEGLIDDGVDPQQAESKKEGKLAQELARADMIVLSLPIQPLLTFFAENRDALAQKAVITDTGSTKSEIETAAKELGLERFVGGHPMAGKPLAGLAHADAELFADVTWFLCPPKDADLAAVNLTRKLVRELGARPVEIDAAEHDLAVAVTSHLPHVLVNALCEQVIEEGVLEAAGGSLRQLTSIAGAPFETWRDTLKSNQAAVASSLRSLAKRLQSLADNLDDEDRVRDLFARGRSCRERLSKGRAPDSH